MKAEGKDAMDEIAVSIIMPVYNEEKYLPTALESLAKQTMRDFELICIDDGSTDGSVEILEQYRDRFPLMTVIRQKNQYAGVARNSGMAVAKGKYLSFLDADDYFMPTMLEEAFICAERVGADVVIYDGEFFTDNIEKGVYGGVLKTQYLKDDLLILDDDTKARHLFNIAGAWPWNKLFLRQFIEKSGLKFQARKRANDIFFVELALAFAHRIAVIDKKLVAYRKGNRGSLTATRDETPLASAEALLDVKKMLMRKGLYNKYENSFKNLVLFICIGNLNTLETEKGFLELYNAFQDWIIDEFDMYDFGGEKYLASAYYKEIKRIIENRAPISFMLEANREAFRCGIDMERVSKELTEAHKEMGRRSKELAEANREIKRLERNLAVKVREIKIALQKFVFPFGMVPGGCDIVLYAAGKVGKSFYSQVTQTNYCNILAWVDEKAEEMDDKRISLPDKEIFLKCDFVVISVLDGGLAEEIRLDLIVQYSVPEEKVIWTYPCLEE